MPPSPTRSHYDVVIAGARCAGASTALLLARGGARVLVVDPLPEGSDTLSTHALMRGAVLQLHRWGVLEDIRRAGTPPIRTTTFHYGADEVELPIKSADGVDALYAPRRTVLDAHLVRAARNAGAEIVHGPSVRALSFDAAGRVVGVEVSDSTRAVMKVSADLVVGADGLRSKVGRLVGAETSRVTRHAAASIYGYWRGLSDSGNHWYFERGVSVGTIPTNDDTTCVFALVPDAQFEVTRPRGLAWVHREALGTASPRLAARVAAASQVGKLRAFAGVPGFLKHSAGPGWALVGDAGYFKDPITAHGITDALRDAELLARAVLRGGDDALAAYVATRDDLGAGLLEVTDRIASFEWDLEEVQRLHFELSRQMKEEVEHILSLDFVEA